ncbi:crossover junction endodeoxyribonuclease RuvC [Psittacicella hinzii]|uniref:Crossover junction endodeoxyribonuclease RuvC n=1 Tax=Psittacicella hinzii TaxID=2028575 RepID=A0A3A1YPC8_9GAMM|nr:crossover junction endodeoxyribonuclease RuvC [Psittacicella hinzii]RIY38810.1 crossover junction endodeoxyribonuclease RuvC [Psittacicella hinzii]
MTIIIGLDPGSINTGYGIIRKEGSKIEYITSGVISVKGSDINARLPLIYTQLQEVIATYQPEHMVIEQVFIAENPQSAIKLGMARGIAILAASLAGATIFELSARQAKKFVTGSGGAGKEVVNKMVCRILKLTQKPKLDASDALALAIAHANTHNTRMMIHKQQERLGLFDAATQRRIIDNSLNRETLAHSFSSKTTQLFKEELVKAELGKSTLAKAELSKAGLMPKRKLASFTASAPNAEASHAASALNVDAGQSTKVTNPVKEQVELANIHIRDGRMQLKSGKDSNRAKLEAKIKKLLEAKNRN